MSGGQPWTAQEIVLVRIESEGGLVGWGEAFSYSCQRPVVAAIEDMIAPLVVGREVTNVSFFMRELQQAVHLFGRYGVVMFGFSGLDIALWDLAAKAAGKPLARLINDRAPLTPLPGYASLYRYGDAELVAAKCRAALGQGYRVIKLHEVTEAEVQAARRQIGEDIALIVDVNCAWSLDQSRAMARSFRPYSLLWLEEPIFPPDDFAALATLNNEAGIALAAGENLCTRYQIGQMIAAGAVSYVQPSVTKVGGVTEFLAAAELTQAGGLKLMPHSPYFGPGWLATLQLISAVPEAGYVERLFVELQASLYGDYVNPADGNFKVPDGPGLGLEPDPDVIDRYRL